MGTRLVSEGAETASSSFKPATRRRLLAVEVRQGESASVGEEQQVRGALLGIGCSASFRTNAALASALESLRRALPVPLQVSGCGVRCSPSRSWNQTRLTRTQD